MLNQEIHALESQSSHNARYINEAVQLFKQNSYTELFQGNLRASYHPFAHVLTFCR